MNDYNYDCINILITTYALLDFPLKPGYCNN